MTNLKLVLTQTITYTMYAYTYTYIHVCYFMFHLYIGVLIISGALLYSYFWLLYICHLALKVFYPLRSAKLFKSHHSRVIYIAEVLVVFLIATVPSIILAIIGQNYNIIGFPPTFCVIDTTYRIYVIVIPILVTSCVSIILMSLVIYRLHMVN